MENQLTFLAQPTIENTSQKKCLAPHIISIFVDGASRNNPGPSGAGIYITHGDEVLVKTGYYLGKKTNNQAEYLALLIASFIAQKEISKRAIPRPRLVITSDSELLVKQMNGSYKIKNSELIKIKTLIDQILKEQDVTFKHVLREKNKIADALANEGIDNRKKPPLSIIAFLTTNKMVI